MTLPQPRPSQATLGTQYLDVALQYHLAGRSAVFARSIPVAGNLFHHAVEMLLKFFLYDHYPGGQLKSQCDVCVVVPSDSMQIIEDAHLVILHSVFLQLM